MSARISAWLAVAAVTLGCGTNRPTIPDELLHDEAGIGAAGYPAGPYCTNVNDCVEGAKVGNFTFADGWMNPAADGYDIAKLKPISFSDFYDPTGAKYELLMVNTAAFWCGACQVEHGGSTNKPSLNEHVDALGTRGFAIFSLVFQDAQSNPATVENLKAWAETFETRFALARDPEYQMGRYAASQNAPLNLVIDAKTMTILRVFLGDQSAVIWPFVENELQARGK